MLHLSIIIIIIFYTESNFWFSFRTLHTGKEYADPRIFFRMIFGKYKRISFKIKGPFVLYDEHDKKTEKNEKNEVEFNFGEDPEENVKEIFKGLKNKDCGLDEYMGRFDILYKAYSAQQNDAIDGDIINTNLNLIGNP